MVTRIVEMEGLFHGIDQEINSIVDRFPRLIILLQPPSGMERKYINCRYGWGV